MNSNYFTRCSSINYSVEVVGMDCVARRRTTHSEDEDQQDEEEEDALVATHHHHGSHGHAHAHAPAIAVAAPFHYLINEQAKSIVALQELQNEVGALLEFRDLVMETFPHLRQKGKGGRRDWEPGIRVKRKLQNRDRDSQSHDSMAATATAIAAATATAQQPRSRSNSHGKAPKSAAEAAANSGTSSAGSSAVQDSGFCAESKEHCSSSTANASVNRKTTDPEAEDELWNLLDLIHVKGTRLRLEVEHLQQKLEKRDELSPPTGFRRRSRSLELISSNKSSVQCSASDRVSLESEMRALKQERDLLLDRIADLEAENLANVARTDRLLSEIGVISAEKRHLQRQIRAASSSQSQLVANTFAPVQTPPVDDYLKLEDGYRITPTDPDSYRIRRPSELDGYRIRPSDPDAYRIRPSDPVSQRLATCDDVHTDTDSTPPRRHVKLGALDGIVSSPSQLKGARGLTPDSKKFSAILKEFNVVELQRHLLVTTFENQVANNRIERLSRSYIDIHHQLEKFKEENDDLRFQLEEKSIELEGTRARIRLLERLQTAKLAPIEQPGSDTQLAPPSHESAPMVPTVLPQTPAIQTILPPMPTPAADPGATNEHHSSSTESAHHEDVAEEEELLIGKAESPKKRPPSKIPLKSYTAPKPPSGRTGKAASVPPPKSMDKASGVPPPKSIDKASGVPPPKSIDKSSREATSLRSKSRETPSLQSRSRESSTSAGRRESLREPRRRQERKVSSSSPQEGSFSSTGSSSQPSVPRPPFHHSSHSPSTRKTSRERERTPIVPTDQAGEHKKDASTVVKEPERLEKTEEFVDSLDNGQEASANSSNCTFLKPATAFDNQELDRSMCSVAQSKAWRWPTPRTTFFDSIDNSATSGFNQSLCLSDREAMAESDSLEPSCSDSGDLV